MTLSLVIGAALIWVLTSIVIGRPGRGLPRHRSLDAVLMIVVLIGISMPVFWLGEVVNLAEPEPVPRHVPLLVGAAARLHAADGVAVRLVQVPVPPVAHPGRPLCRHLRARRSASSMIEAQEQDYVRTALRQGVDRAPRPAPAFAADVAHRLLLPLRPRLRRARRRRCAADRGRLRPPRGREADLRLPPELRPARDHGHRHVRGLLRRSWPTR